MRYFHNKNIAVRKEAGLLFDFGVANTTEDCEQQVPSEVTRDDIGYSIKTLL